MKLANRESIFLTLVTVQLVAALVRGNRDQNVNLDLDLDPNTMLIDDYSSASPANYQCAPIGVGMCSQMAYQLTRMPNFFKDSNQYEANERANLYQDLVNSKCSQHIHTYICELLTPVCLKDSQETMKRFEIYPCRSFCRRIRRDCELELVKSTEKLFSQGTATILPGFACDLLPFESNGGKDSLSGPCHELPDTKASPNKTTGTANVYRPYKPSLDNNTPPFITDTSRIDPSILLKPDQIDSNGKLASNSNPNSKQTSNNADASRFQLVLGQLQTMGQSIIWTLIRYSNILSIITVICLLAALNSKRLRRFKNHLRFSGSSASSSSKSSTASSITNHIHHGKPTYPLISSSPLIHHSQHQHTHQHPLHHNQLSPSSSSRSLVLIAGKNKQHPSHQLVAADQSMEPSQKLLPGLNQKTLINVNKGESTTLMMNNTSDKQQQRNQHPQQHQQLFNTINSHSNQYDYIQHPSQSNRQQQQMYSNILLSSPGHQVWLAKM